MKFAVAGFAVSSSVLLAAAGGTAQPPAAASGASAEAPVEIPFKAGEWALGVEARPLSRPDARRADLVYRAEAFPRLSPNLIRIECRFRSGARVEVTGLIPAQRFPQPEVMLRVGSLSWTGTPSAIYTARSAPTRAPRIPDSQLDDNLKGRDLSWPGHPPYARLQFFAPPETRLAQAIAGGDEIQIEFNGQSRRFPAVPAATAERFARACAEAGSG